jgi:hypothetical protein
MWLYILLSNSAAVPDFLSPSTVHTFVLHPQYIWTGSLSDYTNLCMLFIKRASQQFRGYNLLLSRSQPAENEARSAVGNVWWRIVRKPRITATWGTEILSLRGPATYRNEDDTAVSRIRWVCADVNASDQLFRRPHPEPHFNHQLYTEICCLSHRIKTQNAMVSRMNAIHLLDVSSSPISSSIVNNNDRHKLKASFTVWITAFEGK